MTGQPMKRIVSPEKTQFLWEHRISMESFLADLRGLGAHQVESIMAVRHVACLSLGEAKKIVHFSATWGDMRASSEASHESMFEALDMMQREEHAELVEHVASQGSS